MESLQKILLEYGADSQNIYASFYFIIRKRHIDQSFKKMNKEKYKDLINLPRKILCYQ